MKIMEYMIIYMIQYIKRKLVHQQIVIVIDVIMKKKIIQNKLGGEKFYGYILWLKFILKIVNDESNCKFNGVIRWMGEEIKDIGIIEVINNEIIETDYIKNQLKHEEYLKIKC